MLEPFVRRSLPRLQPLYDRSPHAARNLLTSIRGAFLARFRYAPRMFATLSQLRSHEWWTPAQIVEHQLAALRDIVRHALRTVPFYAAYPVVDVHSFDGLRRLPVLARETVRRNSAFFLSDDTPNRRLIRAATTGTTGARLQVVFTEDMARDNWAFLLRQWAWAGVGPGSPRLTLFGSRVVPPGRAQPPYWTYNRAERQHLLSIFHLSDATAPAYLAFLRAHRGEVLEGFPSALSVLADFVLRRGEQIPMRVVFSTGEPLYPLARRKIETAFGASVFDHYGMTELCGLIQQCERRGMHLIPEFGFLEILGEDNEPAPPGGEGYLVWTSFLNRAMPLLRYRIGDRGRWLAGEACPCGRAFPLVMPTITRDGDLLHSPDGRIFSPRALNQLLKRSTALRFCQFVRTDPNRVLVRAVPAPEAANEASAEITKIRAALQRVLGDSMTVAAELASQPIVRAGGKIPLVVERSAQPPAEGTL